MVTGFLSSINDKYNNGDEICNDLANEGMYSGMVHAVFFLVRQTDGRIV